MTGALGLLMGFALSRMGFSDFGEVHRMFTFADLRLTLSFATAVLVIAFAFRFFRAAGEHAPRRLHPGSIPGGLLFGIGWGLCGACPSIAWVQLGEGQWLASVTIAGLLFGTASYPRLHQRYFRWPTESCQG